MCVGGQSAAKMMTEGFREFCSVLESVIAAGVITIVWQGKVAALALDI